MKKVILYFIIVSSSAFFSCSEETVTPQLFGSIVGVVYKSGSSDPIGTVSISTKPPTNLIVTDANGRFSLEGVPIGNYQVKASKVGFTNGVVNVSVKEDAPTQTTIFMEEP